VQENRARIKRARTNRRIVGCASLLAVLAIAATGSTAHAQSGGTGTTTTPTPPATTAGSWTVYKKATWYGPGFWGRQTACGLTLAPTVIGAAHRKLPCGTTVTFSYAGRAVTGTVIDRGPFRKGKGYAWDLTKKTAKRIGFLAVGKGPVAATVTPAY
jgi:rare lipoprotein A